MYKRDSEGIIPIPSFLRALSLTSSFPQKDIAKKASTIH